MSWKVLVTARTFDSVGAGALEMLAKAGCEVVLPSPLGPFPSEALLPKLPGVDAVLASPDGFNAEILSSPEAASLKIISRWGVGYDSIDIPAATRNGVVVAYTPGMLNETVADWTFTLLLGMARRLHLCHASMARHEWQNHWGDDVFGRTLGLVGCGRIGRAVAKRALGFGMRVIAHDLHPDPSATEIQYLPFESVLQESDYLSLHAALTPQSRGLIGEAQLRLMKPRAYLVNTARGPLVDEAALRRALDGGWIAGAALDVFTKEPLPLDSPLRGAPNLLLAPHNASFARDTGEAVSNAAAEAIIALKSGLKPKWVVDSSVFEAPNLRAKLLSL